MDKFRAWEKKTSTLIDWNCICQSAFNENDTRYSLMYRVFTDPEIIMIPFVGCEDSDGIEVYAGDIMWCNKDCLLGESVGYIKYHPVKLQYRLVNSWNGWWNYTHGDYKIIGNIYQHAHYLKEYKKSRKITLDKDRSKGVKA